MSVLALLQASDLGKLLPHIAVRLATEAARPLPKSEDGHLSKGVANGLRA